MAIDIWDPPTDISCKSCGYDGGVKHNRQMTELLVKNKELETKLATHQGLNGDARFVTITVPAVAKMVAVILCFMFMSIAACDIANRYAPPKPMETKIEFSGTTEEHLIEAYENCIKDPVATPEHCLNVMRAMVNTPQEPAQ